MRLTYTLLDEINASTKKPLDAEKIRHQLTRMHEGLHHMETATKPTIDDWQVVSDAVNMLETLIKVNDGWWLDCDGDPVQVKDTSGLLEDAVAAMAEAGRRHTTHGVIRLDAKGIHTLRGVLEDYAQALQTLPARTMIHCHRKTEKRIIDILKGKKQPHDVVVKKKRKN